MPNGSLSLAEYPGAMVRLTCSKCGRSGQHRKANLIEKYGREIPLPDLLRQVAGDCPKMDALGNDLGAVVPVLLTCERVRSLRHSLRGDPRNFHRHARGHRKPSEPGIPQHPAHCRVHKGRDETDDHGATQHKRVHVGIPQNKDHRKRLHPSERHQHSMGICNSRSKRYFVVFSIGDSCRMAYG